MNTHTNDNCIELPRLELDTPTHDDLEKIAELINRNWHLTYDQHLPEKLTRERTAEVFRSLLVSRKPGNATIARFGKKIVGYADHLSNCVDNLWVDSSYQRRGIGRKLLDVQLEKLKSKDMQSAQAGCESFNTKAIAFYQNAGWHVIDDATETIIPGLNVGIIVYGHHLT